jgi:hypothetical protein
MANACNPTVAQPDQPLRRLTGYMAAVVLATLVWLGAQQPATPQQEPKAAPAAELPVSLDRIQRALSAPPPLNLKEQAPVFRLEIVGRKPTLEDILGERFWLGPTPYGGMTHQDFLDMVTPKVAQPFGGFSGKYLVAQTALTLAEQWALKQAITKFRSALTDHEREAARKEVMDALAALEKARREAGLPPK